MKQISLLFFATFLLLSGCKKPSPKEPAPHAIVIFAANSSDNSGTTIKADNKDEVSLKCSVKDINGIEISTSCDIMLNGEKYNGSSFKTGTPGNYVFQASIGEIVSNTYTVTATNDKTGDPYKIELSSDRTEIMANDIQEVIFHCKVTDINGVVLPVICAFTVNETPSDNTFKTAVKGEYTVQASFGSLQSNKIMIRATDEVEGKPFKIILDSDRYLGIIKADNKDEAMFKVRITDITGKVLNDSYKLTISGTPFSGTSFKTDKPGDYVFQASIGTLTSNSYIVTAKEIADPYITLQNSKISNVTSAGIVTVDLTFKNNSTKTLKYVTFDVSCYSKDDQIIKEATQGSTFIGCQATGFFDPGLASTSSFQLGSFPGVDHIKVTLRSVTLEDGTVITAG